MRILHRNCCIFTCVMFLLVSFNVQAISPLSNARLALNFVVYPIVGPDTIPPIIVSLNSNIYLDANGNVNISPGEIASISDSSQLDTVIIDQSTFSCQDLGNNTVNITAIDGAGGLSTGNFITTTGIVNGSQRTVMAVGDPDNDGIDDILLTNSFYKNNGTGTFFSSQNLSAGAGQNGGVVGDLNGDGNDDLINGMYVYLWNGSSMVYKEYLGPTDAVFGNPTLVDLDGDGDLDLYRPSYYQNPERVFLNDGTGSFTLDSSYAAGSFQICATSGDFDEDGDMDIIAAGYYNVYFAQNDGNAKLSYTSIHSNGNFYINRIYATDINNDGHLDLVYSNCCSAFEYMLGNGDGTFASPTPVIGTHSNGSRSISIGDYEGDGDIDVLEVGSEVVLWKNDGNANFQEQLTGFTGYMDAVMGDFNGDGVQDIAASRWGPGLVSISEISIGNSATATANLNVLDTISPVVVVQNVILQLDANGSTQATVSDIDNNSYDNCTIDSIWTSGVQLSFDCSDLGNSYLVTLHARDFSGNTASTTATVTIADDSHPCNQPPIALCQNLTIYTNANCMGAFSALIVNNGSYDPDGDSLVYNTVPVGPLVIGVHNILLTVTDPLGESSSCNATITVLDSTSPFVATQDITVYLDAVGSASIVAADINNGSSDICGIASTSIDVSSFGCANVGANNVILTVNDNNGNSATGSASVIIIDSISPIVSCQNLTLALGANGLVDLNPAMIDNGSSDACGIGSVSVSPLSFTCNEVGSNIVTLTVTDVNGNISNCQSTVTVIDTIVPFVLTQNVSIVLDNLGNASVSAADIDAGSVDACGIASLALDNTSFTCANVGANTVVLTVTDVNGNVSSASATVTVEDNIAPTITTLSDFTVNTDNGECSALVNFETLILNYDPVGYHALITPVGASFVNPGFSAGSLTVNGYGNTFNTHVLPVGPITTSSTLVASEFVEFSFIAPQGTFLSSVTYDKYSYYGTGATQASIRSSLDNFGSDISTISVNPVAGELLSFDISSLTSFSGQITFRIYFYGSIFWDYMDLVSSSYGGSGVSVYQKSISEISDNCDASISYTGLNSNNVYPLGTTTISSTATDASGNTISTSFVLTVIDVTAPAAITQDITVQLDASGNTSITTTDIDNGSNDACGIASLALDNTSFTCANVGGNTVVLTVTDNNGKVSTATATVTVEDNVAPIAITNDIVVQLDASGNVSITTGDIDNGSNDACGIASLALDNTSFTCANVGGNTVVLTVTDNNGKVSTATATVTVEDNVAPIAITNDIVVQLDASGNGSITTSDIDNGSNDACGIASLALDNTAFTCANVGVNTVVLTVTDNNGNVSSASATVKVEDNVAPIAITNDIVVQLDASGNVSITTGDIDNGSNDACGIASVALDNIAFDCSNVGANTVVLTVTDNNGNVSTATATVTVEDNVAPIALTQNIAILLDHIGNASITAADIDHGSNDACGIASLVLDTVAFDCSDLGSNTVTLTVTDNNGNVSSATATVEVSEDDFIHIKPIANIDTTCNTGIGGRHITWDAPALGTYTSCATDTCPGGTNLPGFKYIGTHNGHRYFSSKSGKHSWNEANALAQAAGGHLAVINNEAENHFLACRVHDSYNWIGLTDQNVEGKFEWINDEAVTYTKWDKKQPNNKGGKKCGYNCHAHQHGHHGNGHSSHANGHGKGHKAHGNGNGYGHYGNNNCGTGADHTILKRGSGKWKDRTECNKYDFIMEMPCGNDVEINQIAGPAPGSLFTQGTTTVTYAATDSVTGATDTMSFDVTIGNCTPPPYCTVTGISTQYEWIEEVKLGSINNTSGDNGGYADYTNLIAHSTTGKKINFKLYPGFSNCKFKEYWRIFVDWNNDGDFNDYKECVYQGKSSKYVKGKFKVPSWAASGTLRVRVMMKWGGYPKPCTNFANGEVEDYSIIIDNATGGGANTKNSNGGDLLVDETVNQELYNLYPNPVLSEGIMHLEIRSAVEANTDLHIMSATGQVLFIKNATLRQGLNSIEITPGRLSPGAYFIRISKMDVSIPFVVKK